MKEQPIIGVIGDMAEAVNCPTPLFTACVPLYHAAMAQGLAQSDTASVCEVLNLIAGVGGASISGTASRRSRYRPAR